MFTLRNFSYLWKNQNIQRFLGENFNKLASKKSLHVTGGERHSILSELTRKICNVYIFLAKFMGEFEMKDPETEDEV